MTTELTDKISTLEQIYQEWTDTRECFVCCR